MWRTFTEQVEVLLSIAWLDITTSFLFMLSQIFVKEIAFLIFQDRVKEIFEERIALLESVSVGSTWVPAYRFSDTYIKL